MATSFHRSRSTLLCAASLLCLSTGGIAFAQDSAPAADSAAGQDGAVDIVVTGIRASQARAIGVKRDAASVVDAISAEDIGKLPDVTISDSLQRITGVQIRRDAGEGAAINIRGLPQVTTLLNGEAYLGANSITTIQPNFNDIPSQLFSGADVIKSTTADLLNAGITGTVNLRTRRPFDLKRGLTLAATAEGSYGDKTKSWDPNVNGLIGWQNDRVGFIVSAAYSDLNLSNSHNGIQEGYGAALHNESIADATSCGGFSPQAPGCTSTTRPRGKAVAGGIDVNGDGDANDTFIVPQGFTAWNRITQRQRLGVNGSFQAKLNDALTFTADGFYTRQTQYNRTAGIQMQDVNWQAAEFVPTKTRNTGAKAGGFDVNTIQAYQYDLGNFDSYSETYRWKSESQNYNAELHFDNGGKFRATLRGLYGKAKQDQDQSYLQFSLSNGTQWQPGGIGHYPAAIGGDRAFNPAGYTVNTLAGANSLQATVDYSGDQPSFTLPTQLTSLLGNAANYALKTMSSEDNYRRNADLKVARFDAEYDVSDLFNITAGARYSDRSVDNYQFERVAPVYAGQGASNAAGCLVKWKAFDVSVGDKTCSAGNAAGFYTAGLTRKATDAAFNGQVKQYSLPGSGLPAIYVLDPHAMDNAAAFQNSFYPNEQEHMNPGASYDVGIKQWSGYFQLNFKELQLGGITVRGNGGLRVINTKLDIRQNIVGGPLPYGLSNQDGGDLRTKRNFTDFLPAFNLAFDFTPKLRLRLAYARTMTLLNLDQWGGGLTPNYAIQTDPTTGQPIFRVTGGSQAGNPQLDPWRADNLDASLEYYIGKASMVSLAAFYIDVQSFIQNGIIYRSDLPDNDGVVRNRTVPINTLVQGGGGTLKGVEASWKQSFGDIGFLPTFVRDFGYDLNFTYSPSTTGDKDLAGKDIPFQDNSKYQANAALYYQAHGVQARVAWNYRSKRAVQSNFVNGLTGSELYQAPTNYVDASISYDITPNLTIYGQGQNLTGEYEKYYIVYPDERAYNNIYERRFMAGARFKF